MATEIVGTTLMRFCSITPLKFDIDGRRLVISIRLSFFELRI